MDFNEVVKDLVESVAGGIAAVIMANDGIAIAEYIKPGQSLDIQTMGVEYTSVLSEIKKASEVLQAGTLEELTVCTESNTLIVRVVTNEYFVGVTLSTGGNYGKGRYLIRVAAHKLAEEF